MYVHPSRLSLLSTENVLERRGKSQVSYDVAAIASTGEDQAEEDLDCIAVSKERQLASDDSDCSLVALDRNLYQPSYRI